MPPARFVTEFGLNMYASSVVLLQDDGLSRLPELQEEGRVAEFHLYVIGARPRITVDPARFAFTRETIEGVFIAHRGDERVEFKFGLMQSADPDKFIDRVESEWPHTTLRLLRADKMVFSGKVALFAPRFCRDPALHEFLDLEVLYVGQSYGSSGEREAPARLQSHSTLQQIFGEASRLQPDKEIWLVLLAFEQLLMTRFDGRLANLDPEGEREGQEKLESFMRSGIVSEQQRINFTEAALIRYFEPRYNKTFRTTFPSAAHESYRECYDIDLNMVSAEVNTEDIETRLYSQSRERTWIHYATFPLHDRNERTYMLDFLLPDKTEQ